MHVADRLVWRAPRDYAVWSINVALSLPLCFFVRSHVSSDQVAVPVTFDQFDNAAALCRLRPARGQLRLAYPSLLPGIPVSGETTPSEKREELTHARQARCSARADSDP